MVFKNCLGMIMSVSTLIIFNGAATPSSTVNFSMFHPARSGCAAYVMAKWRVERRGSTLCHRRDRRRFFGSFPGLELRLAVERANLDVVLGVVLLPRQLLRRNMLGIGPPGPQSVFVLEFDDGDPLAVVGEKPFMRDITRHGLG